MSDALYRYEDDIICVLGSAICISCALRLLCCFQFILISTLLCSGLELTIDLY